VADVTGSWAVARNCELRALRSSDAIGLAEAYRRNRTHLSRWEPKRDEAFFTVESQQDLVASALAAELRGDSYSFVLLDEGAVVGRVNLTGVVRGPFQSANLGYWIDVRLAGRGIMTSAITVVLDIARKELDLHRVQASVMPANRPSVAVLTKTGFAFIGAASRYLKIAGAWEDHDLYDHLLES
jgi:[ribosomal protein S5]-alanine N-acetyltransferase